MCTMQLKIGGFIMATAVQRTAKQPSYTAVQRSIKNKSCIDVYNAVKNKGLYTCIQSIFYYYIHVMCICQ